jgi:hypothetical protein
MNEPTSEQTKKDYILLDEFVRQIATQAALLAGFTFTILTATSLEAAPYRRAVAFVICATLTIALELLTAFVLSSLAFIVKINFSPRMEDAFQTEMNLAWVSYLLGLVFFLATLVLLAWIKYLSAALPVSVIIFAIFLVGVAVFWNMVRKQNKLG